MVSLGVVAMMAFAGTTQSQMVDLALVDPGPFAFMQGIRIGPVDTSVTTIYVSGSATIHLPAERATLVIAIEGQGATPDDAASKLAERMRAIGDTLRAMGVAQSHLKEIPYGISVSQQFDPGFGPMPKGERPRTARTILRVDSLPLAELQRTTRAVLVKGATNSSVTGYESSGRDAAKREALSRAIASARRDAEGMAVAAGGSLGKLLELSGANPAEVMSGFSSYMDSGAMDALFMGAEQGYFRGGQRPSPEVVVTVTVTARWLFKEKK